MKLLNSLAILSLTVLVNGQISADTASWVGGNNSNDLSTPANWSTNSVPSGTGIFQNGTTTPTLGIGTGSTDVTLDTLLFPSTSNNAYNFEIGPDTSTINLNLQGVGVQVDNNQQQTFTIADEAYFNFNNSSSAYAGSGITAPIYNIVRINPMLNRGEMVFNDDSTAGNAIINCNGGSVTFNGNSTAANSKISSDGEYVSFYDSSTAGTSSIEGSNGATLYFNQNTTGGSSKMHVTTGSSIQFYQSSTMGAATLTADTNSTILQYVSDPTSSARINLLTGSQFTLNGSHLTQRTASVDGDASASIDLGGNELTVGYGNFDSYFRGNIFSVSENPAVFDKIGTGTFTLTGSGDYNTTNINEGKYVLNGTLKNQTVTVLPNAVLRGSGSIVNATVNVAGTIAPGNSIGTLDIINGPFNQLNGSNHGVEINGLGESTLVNVTGVGSVAAIGTNTAVNVSSEDGTFLIGSQYNYRILHADQGVTGTYTSVTQDISPFLVPHLFYTPDPATDVYLNLTTDFASYTRNCDQCCLATLLDKIAAGTPSDDQEAVLVALASLPTAKDLRASLNSLSGYQYTHLGQLSAYTDYRFARRLFSSVRNLIASCRCDTCRKFEPWIRAEYDYAEVKRHRGGCGLKDNSWDISFGTHYYAAPNLVFGVAGNYSSDHVKFHLDRKNNNFQTGQGSLYGVYQNKNFYLFSDIILGETWVNHFKRNIEVVGREAGSKVSIFHGKYYAEIGAQLNLCQVVVEPFFGADAGWYCRDKIKERGAGFLNRDFHKRSETFGDTYLGVHLLGCLCNQISVGGDLYWQHRCGSFDRHLSATFNGPDTICGVDGAKFGRDGVVGTVNMTSCFCDKWEVYAEFNGQSWKNFSSCGVTLGVNYGW